MMNKDAIEALQEGKSIENAFKAMSRASETNDVVMLPSNYTSHDLERMRPYRRRARGGFETAEIASFANYVGIHAEEGCMVFVDQDAMTAKAVLNLGTPGHPGHADNHAKLLAVQTAAYKALLRIAGGGQQKQATIAEFLEDWPEHITCFHGTEQLSPPKAIAAIRKITIEGLRKVESEEQQLSASRSAFESVQATSTEKLPTLIYFKCQPFSEFQERTFVLRMQIHTGNDKPALSLRVVKAELHAEEMAQELASKVAKAFGALPVLLGTYTKAQ